MRKIIFTIFILSSILLTGCNKEASKHVLSEPNNSFKEIETIEIETIEIETIEIAG